MNRKPAPHPGASRVRYADESCVLLRSASFEAKLLPRVGGNCISFDDLERRFRYLRTPSEDDLDAFRSYPARWGIPILFPPNRTADGRFTINGRSYRFPINEPENGNHLHGPFLTIPWKVQDLGTDGDTAYVLLEQDVDQHHPVFEMIPHRFRLSLRYSLSSSGLKQDVTIKNRSEAPLPGMLGFHTALRTPFAAGSSPDDCRVRVPINQRWECNDRLLPTGKLLELTTREKELATRGIPPQHERWSSYYSAADTENGRRQATVSDLRIGSQLVYEVASAFSQWVLWNDDAESEFFCAEPQTCTPNAANLDVPREQTGLFLIEPGEVWHQECKLYAKEL